jgi:TM2 domain-containing membrane protein YozV
MIICPKCQNSVDDNANFCTYCGIKLSSAGASGAPADGGPPQQQPKEGQPPQPGGPQGGSFQPEAGNQVTPPGYGPPQGSFPPGPNLPYGQQPYPQVGPISPKSRNVVILLCFFLGSLGIHRFYLGKIVTGILMILTLGGLGIWTLVDFFFSIFENYKDSKGQYIEKQYNKRMVNALMICFILIPAVMIGAGILIPQYAKERMRENEKTVKYAYFNVFTSEDLFYFNHNEYTSDYDLLSKETEFVLTRTLNTEILR